MRMYIANATAQHFEFFYRLPKAGGIPTLTGRIQYQEKRRQQSIRAGGQIVLADDLNQAQIDSIVKQHEKYGLVPADEATNSRTQKRFAGLCYSIDKPVSSARIEALLRGNNTVLDARGKAIRKDLALVSNQRVIDALKEQKQMQLDKEVEVGEFELTIQQDVKEGDEISTKEAIGEGFRSDPTGAVKQGSGRRNR